MSTRRCATVAAPLAVAIAAAFMSGCQSAQQQRYQMIKADPTPRLDTLYQSGIEVDNSLTIMADEDWRMFNEDLGRFFYLDRPSKLTREPVPIP